MINCFLRFKAYEVKRLSARFRSIFRREYNMVHFTINRTSDGTIYSAHFKRWGYDVSAMSTISITDLKEKFIKAVIVADSDEN